MRTDHHYAVCVGIDCYPELTNLRLARKDALAFDAWLASAGVADERRERVMLDDDTPPPTQRRGAQPRKDEIFEAVRDKIVQARKAVEADPTIWPDTRFYFFFSGHGIAPSARDASGLAADCSADDYGNSASLRAMVDYLLESGDFAELVVLADACRLSPPRAGTLPGVPPWTQRTGRRPDDVKVAELYATQYRSPARESRDLDKERGWFTQALLEGLVQGEPRARTPEGAVTTGSLIAYARQRVMDLTGGKQKPPRDIGSEGIVLLEPSAVPAAPPAPVPADTRRVRLTLPAGLTAVVRLLDGTGAEVGTHDPAAAGPWEVDLRRGLYELSAGGAALRPDLFKVETTSSSEEVLDVLDVSVALA